jgi:hypothetical protein
MKFVFLLFISSLSSYSIVFVHIGNPIPDYVEIAIEQARLFNPSCPIYLVGNKQAFKKASFCFENNVYCIPLESLTMSHAHLQFIEESKLNKKAFQGFWIYTSERFFYLEELIREFRLTEVFHLENDVMLYADLESMLPIFREKYRGMIGATFDSDSRCIAGLMYVSGINPISQLTKLMAKKAKLGLNDMEMLNSFKNQYDKIYIDHLPIIFPEYTREIGLKNALNETSSHPERYSQYFDSFQAIFDAAAIGQYLGGTSPRNGVGIAGFINENCLFDPSRLGIEWKLDDQERWVPSVSFGNSECPVINLHIHSKELSRFFSKRPL